MSVCVRARVGQLALTELGSLLASNGAAGCPALLSEFPRRSFVAAARQWTAIWNLLSQSLLVLPNDREMYAPQPGDSTGRLPSDYHSVSSLYSISFNGNLSFVFCFFNHSSPPLLHNQLHTVRHVMLS